MRAAKITGFILQPDGEMQEVNVVEFLEWLASEDYTTRQRVGWDRVDGVGTVSTAFLPQIMTRRLRALGGARLMQPFETVIYWASVPGPASAETYARYPTYASAKEGHEAAVAHLRSGGFSFSIGKCGGRT